MPIIAIGDDRTGIIIQDKLSLLSSDKSTHGNKIIKQFIEDPGFFIKQYRTPQSTIIVAGGRRTILQETSAIVTDISAHFRDRIEDVKGLSCRPSAVIVGHLPTVETNGVRDKENDPTTVAVAEVRRRLGVNFPILLNFGQQQIVKGYNYWRDVLVSASNIQLNIVEARQFFSEQVEKGRLPDILDFMAKENITGVITLDKFGAVGNYHDGRDGVIYAEAIIDDDDEVIDPTGAGDAFAAGTIFILQSHKEPSFNTFFNAISEGRVWAAYACTTIGGSAQSPNKATLKAFKSKIAAGPVEVRNRRDIETLLSLVDRAHR